MVYGSVTDGARVAWREKTADWSVLLPFYNERQYLRDTIRGLAHQTVQPLLILIDNASTDRSGEIAREACAEFGVRAIHLHEGRPGKVAALQCGLRLVESRFVATCDADTWYPASYLERAGSLLARPGTVAAIAANSPPEGTVLAARLAGWRLALTGAVLRQQCLNGGASQTFRTAALKACGGFDPAIWNWVLEDHEIMARIEGHGRIRYNRHFICHPATRPRAVDCRGWNLPEQLRYHLTESGERIDYFHEFLAPRLRDRALPSEMLRRIEGLTASA